MNISRRSVLTSGALAAGAAALGAPLLLCKSAGTNVFTGRLAEAASTLDQPAVGVALGSGYQGYFAALSSSAQQSEIERMQAANIAWVRLDADWSTVQPTADGGFDWSVPDETADVMLAAGMKLDILLYESPG